MLRPMPGMFIVMEALQLCQYDQKNCGVNYIRSQCWCKQSKILNRDRRCRYQARDVEC